VEKSRWRIQTEGASRVHVEYTVYGHQMVTEGFDFTPDHLFVNAALCLPYVDGHLSDPVAVTLDVPPEWTVITELEEVERTPRRYRARNYDELVDSPIDAGRPVVLTVRPSGIPHRICLCGEGGNYDAHTLEQDISKIVEAAVALVGDSPLSRYTFFYHLTNVPDGGLEPFDYTRENYTRMLWWMEGTTDYFTGLVLRRAGLASPDQYLEVLAKLV